MQTFQAFLTIVGFGACAALAMLSIVKTFEVVWFFKDFRDKTNRTLERIEETLRNRKP
jgi:hypothetical protein